MLELLACQLQNINIILVKYEYMPKIHGILWLGAKSS